MPCEAIIDHLSKAADLCERTPGKSGAAVRTSDSASRRLAAHEDGLVEKAVKFDAARRKTPDGVLERNVESHPFEPGDQIATVDSDVVPLAEKPVPLAWSSHRRVLIGFAAFQSHWLEHVQATSWLQHAMKLRHRVLKPGG